MDSVETRKKGKGGFFRNLKRQWQLLVLSIPMLIYILIVNDGRDALRGNIGLLPRVFSPESYKSILSDVAVYQAAGQSPGCVSYSISYLFSTISHSA